jgi:hypothetical protein
MSGSIIPEHVRRDPRWRSLMRKLLADPSESSTSSPLPGDAGLSSSGVTDDQRSADGTVPLPVQSPASLVLGGEGMDLVERDREGSAVM